MLCLKIIWCNWIRRISNIKWYEANWSQYYSYIYENNPLYDVIREWDEAFSLDGNLCENPTKQKQAFYEEV